MGMGSGDGGGGDGGGGDGGDGGSGGSIEVVCGAQIMRERLGSRPPDANDEFPAK